MSQDNHFNNAEQDFARTPRQRRTDEIREAVAVPSNTATNNDNNQSYELKVLRFGVDSLYLSFQGNLFETVDRELSSLKKLAQSDRPEQQAKAQFKVFDHLFEVKDKGTSMFSYVLEDNAFRIQLSRPNKSVPMAYIKISSEYLTYKKVDQAVERLRQILCQLGTLDAEANVSRIDLFVDFVTYQNMEAWTREAWVTKARSVQSYAVDNRFSGWSVGMGGVIAARLYDKLFEIIKSNKLYLLPLWQMIGRQDQEPVWRLEFEFKRDLLKQKGIIKISEVLNHLNGLWSYAMTEWLKLTLPNLADSKRDRWPVHPMWQLLSNIDWDTSGGPLKSRFTNTRSPDKKIALHRAYTALTTWMAIHQHKDYELAIHPFFEDLYHYMNNLAMNLGSDFDSLIKEKVAFKARQFNSMDVNADIYEAYVDDEVEAYRKASDGE
ncbi:MAG: replication initiation factor [Methylophilus sp.]|nr:replication initiation factor [Methylophilus sp.]